MAKITMKFVGKSKAYTLWEEDVLAGNWTEVRNNRNEIAWIKVKLQDSNGDHHIETFATGQEAEDWVKLRLAAANTGKMNFIR